MCELLGMSADPPTDIAFSFTGLMQRGGRTGPHKDGWGLTLYQGKGIRDFRDTGPGSTSELAQAVLQRPLAGTVVIGHIREANVGPICLENTHPFTRELWGRHWTFAHNGQLENINELPLERFIPIGSTDSEYAFCWILNQIVARFSPQDMNTAPFWQAVHALCKSLNSYGVFNMLLSDGETLACYCATQLCSITRRAPFAAAALKDANMRIESNRHSTLDDTVTIVATTPLTDDEQWQRFDKGELRLFRQGKATVCEPALHTA